MQTVYQQQERAHQDFTSILGPGCEERWVKQVEAWEANPSQNSPYYNAVKCEGFWCTLPLLAYVWLSDRTVNDVKTSLEDAERKARRLTPGIHETTATACLMLGLLIEEMQ